MDILHFIEFAFIVIVGWTLSAMVLPRISLVSFRRRLFDSVDERKLHTAHIPRLGGIAFFPCITVTVSLAIIGYNLWQGYNILDMDLTNRLLSMLCCLFILYLIGMMDDLIGVRYRSKFVVQILCGILLVDFRVMLRQPIRVVRYLCHTLLHRSAVHSIRHRLYPERHQFDRRH